MPTSKKYTPEEYAINLHVGKRLRRRRKLLGLTQKALGDTINVRFQQIQKYECGANLITAVRLHQLSQALSVPVGYFYEGLGQNPKPNPEATLIPRLEKVLSGMSTKAQIALAEGLEAAQQSTEARNATTPA